MQSEVENIPLNKPKVQITIGANPSIMTYFHDCYSYRDLFLFLSLRDVQVRYKQAFFGIAWALFRPILNMLLLAVVFGKLASLPSHDVNYYLFVLAGILPWQLFVNYLTESSLSVVNNSNLITKLYFPRILVPLAGLLVNLIDFGIGMLFLFILMLFTGDGYLWSCMLVTPFVVLMLLLSMGMTFWLSALTVKYRDFKFIMPLFFQLGMFISPVAYDSDLINSFWFPFYALNPMVGIINGFRFAFFGVISNGFGFSITTATLISLMFFATGVLFFRNMEKHFADQI